MEQLSTGRATYSSLPSKAAVIFRMHPFNYNFILISCLAKLPVVELLHEATTKRPGRPPPRQLATPTLTPLPQFSHLNNPMPYTGVPNVSGFSFLPTPAIMSSMSHPTHNLVYSSPPSSPEKGRGVARCVKQRLQPLNAPILPATVDDEPVRSQPAPSVAQLGAYGPLPFNFSSSFNIFSYYILL